MGRHGNSAFLKKERKMDAFTKLWNDVEEALDTLGVLANDRRGTEAGNQLATLRARLDMALSDSDSRRTQETLRRADAAQHLRHALTALGKEKGRNHVEAACEIMGVSLEGGNSFNPREGAGLEVVEAAS